MTEPIRSNTQPNDTVQPSPSLRPTPEQLQEMLPPSIVIQQQRMADAAHKVAWTSGLSALAGAAIPMAFPEKIAKSVPLRLLFSTASAVGAGIMGAVTSGYIVMRRLDRQNRETATALSGNGNALGQEITAAAQNSPAKPLAPESPQPQSPAFGVEPTSSSFASNVAARDASFATQAAKEATAAAVAGAGIQNMSS